MADILKPGDLDQPLPIGSKVCVFGVFDGVHRGHSYLIEEAIQDARRLKSSAAILTFDIDPDEIFAPRRLVKLMTNEERLETLSKFDVDSVIALPFDRDFAALSPGRFLDTILMKALPLSLHVGRNFRFGSKAEGDITLLEAWGSEVGMKVYGHELLTYFDMPISATRIRECLSLHDFADADLMLGRSLLNESFLSVA